MSEQRRGPRNLLSATATLEQNLGTALFGEAVHTERQTALLKLVGFFESANKRPQRLQAAAARFCERKFDSVARPMLLKALSQLDPEPLREFVAVIEAARRIGSNGPALQFHARALRVAEQLSEDAQFEPGRPLNFTLKEFKAKLRERYWPTRPAEQELSDAYVRRECKAVGIVFKADKVGRPKKQATEHANLKS